MFRIATVILSVSIFASSAFSAQNNPDFLCYSDKALEFLFSFYNRPDVADGSYMTSNLGGRKYDLDVLGQLVHGQDAYLVHRSGAEIFSMRAKYNSNSNRWDAQMYFDKIQMNYRLENPLIQLTCEDYSDELFFRLVELGY